MALPATVQQPLNPVDALRIGLVPLFVMLCYTGEWSYWRSAVARIMPALLRTSGATALPLYADSFIFHGSAFQIVVSCTALDVFFGSIPLLWERDRSIRANAGFLARWLLTLTTLNLARLYVGFLLYGAGVPWWLGHEVLSGVFYFGVLVWIVRRRGWSVRWGGAHSQPVRSR